MNDLVPAADAPKAVRESSVIAGAQPLSLIPTTLEGVWQMAKIISVSPFCPKDMNTLEACSSAIMLGLDVGLNPIQAVQSIAVINNRPSIWGDAALALCLAHPLCEDVTEEFGGDPNKEDTWFWTCSAVRKGRANPVVRTFSYADAKRAMLWDKAGPWKNYPKRMMQLRARAFALRDAFPDILKGLAIREEMEDVDGDDHGGRRKRHNVETPKPPGSTAAGNVIDAEVRDVTGQQEQPKPAETVKPKDEARSAQAGERKPAETEKVDTAAQERRYEEVQERQQEQQAETERNDDDTFPGDRPSQRDRVPDYKGSELLAEFSEELDNFGSVEEIDTWLGKAKNGKPNRGMVIVAALNPADQEEARELYKQAKARIEAHAAGEQQGGGDAEKDGDAEAQVNDAGAEADADEQEQSESGEAEDDGDQQDPSTMSWAEYDAYARSYIDKATDKDLLKKIWFSESTVRTALEKAGAPKAEVEALKAYRTAKINQLAGIA